MAKKPVPQKDGLEVVLKDPELTELRLLNQSYHNLQILIQAKASAAIINAGHDAKGKQFELDSERGIITVTEAK